MTLLIFTFSERIVFFYEFERKIHFPYNPALDAFGTWD